MGTYRGMRRGKARCARSIIIHPAHYPSTGTIDDPTPILVHSAVPGSISLPRIRRDGNLAESFAIYERVNARPTPTPPPARVYLLGFIREQDEQRYLPVPRQ